jgi:hypothetical protein
MGPMGLGASFSSSSSSSSSNPATRSGVEYRSVGVLRTFGIAPPRPRDWECAFEGESSVTDPP